MSHCFVGDAETSEWACVHFSAVSLGQLVRFSERIVSREVKRGQVRDEWLVALWNRIFAWTVIRQGREQNVADIDERLWVETGVQWSFRWVWVGIEQVKSKWLEYFDATAFL